MTHTFTIFGRLLGLNDMTHHNRFAYGAKKKAETRRCAMSAMLLPKFNTPVKIAINWIEPNKRRDIDNVAAGVKFILDGLVEAGKLPNDARNWVKCLSHGFQEIDPKNPRIEVIVEGV